MIPMNKAAPTTLKSKWKTATFLLSLLPPIEANRAVDVVPIFAPNKTGKMPKREIDTPALTAYRPCTTPTTALDDWIQTVAMMPINRPSQGCSLRAEKREMNQLSSAMVDKYSSIIHKPRKSAPKAKASSPISVHFFFVANKRIAEPMKRISGKYSIKGIETIKAVIVVPTFAPIITAAA